MSAFTQIIAALSIVSFAGGMVHTVPRDFAHQAPTVADTVDVPVGSPVLDGNRMTAFTTHLQVHRMGTPPQLVQEATNTIAFGDSANTPVTRVVSIGEAAGPNGKAKVTSQFTFDRKTLALLGMHTVSPMGDMSVRANGLDIDLTLTNAAGSRTIPLRLSSPAFYAQWSDYVVEELPRQVGKSYRVPLWRIAMQPGAAPKLVEETHLYVVKGRENIAVLNAKPASAWVVEDRSADGATLLGKMWIVDGPPKLVRWDIAPPAGPTIEIDQELVALMDQALVPSVGQPVM